jgi:tetratricopeptide (TPR) repeat protein
MRWIIDRLLLVLTLCLLGMPGTTAPVGAIQPLWAEAARLHSDQYDSAAIDIYEQIASVSPQDPAPLLAAGEIYLTQRRWALAEDAFNRALARNGGDASGLAGLAESRWNQGDLQKALSLWEAALAACDAGYNDRQGVCSGIHVRLALGYLDMQRWDDAEAMLRQGLARRHNPAAHLYLAMIQAVGDTRAARQELAAIADTGPSWLVEGRDYLRATLDQAGESGSAAETAKLLGIAYVQIEEWQLAGLALRRALRLDPEDAETMAFLGYTQAQLNQPAFDHLAGAVQARPDWPLGHYLLGLYYLKQGAYEFAAEEFRVTLRLDPGNAQAQVDLARAYVGLGQYLDAEEALVRAVQSAPRDLTFHLALVRFYADHAYNITGRGLDAAQKAADLAPDNAQVRDMLGWMYFLAGDPDQARLHLESALHLDPGLASTYYHLGMLNRALGRDEEARSALLRVLDLDTDGFYRDQALTALREMALISPSFDGSDIAQDADE